MSMHASGTEIKSRGMKRRKTAFTQTILAFKELHKAGAGVQAAARVAA